jgi:putative ABC transport system ATP-binding protein
VAPPRCSERTTRTRPAGINDPTAVATKVKRPSVNGPRALAASRPERDHVAMGVDTKSSRAPTVESRPATGRHHGHRDEARTLVELRGVSRRYVVGSSTFTALADVDLEIDEGELVVVLGPSGSGKTTLLNLIGALDTPSEGIVQLDGRDVSGLGRRALGEMRRQLVGFVFQSFNLFLTLTALENVQLGAETAGRANAFDRAVEMLGEVGLEARLDHFPHELSGGEQQRVAVARALASGNPIVLADEPSGELDFRTGVQILELLADSVGPGRAAIIVTHNREIARTADRVVELSSGRIVSDGPPAGGRAAIADLRW